MPDRIFRLQYRIYTSLERVLLVKYSTAGEVSEVEEYDVDTLSELEDRLNYLGYVPIEPMNYVSPLKYAAKLAFFETMASSGLIKLYR